MKRSINRWTTLLAMTALLGLPLAAIAHAQQPSTPPQQQQPAPQPTQPQPQPDQPQPAPQPTQPQPQPTQPPAQPQPTEPQPTQPPAQPQPAQPQPTEPPQAPPTTATQPTPTAQTQADQSVSPEEHLRQARAAFSDIKMTSLPARSRAEFAQLRRHLAALDNPSAPATSNRRPANRRGSTGAATTSGASNWGTEVAAIDRIITNLMGTDTATGTSGTSGMPGATGTAGSSRSKTSASIAIDDATRAKLMEIRTHITAYAAGKSGASSTPRSDAASMTADQAASSTNAQTAANAPAAANAPTPSTTAGEAPATPQATAAAPKVDAEIAHRALLSARDSLNQLTQLPAAAQLTGEARTQVQQLIANFNELITTKEDWRSSYTKVAANLTALLGPDNTDAEATGGAPTTATGAAAAVGTGGAATVQLDPAVRAKLVELRTNLSQFAKASGGLNK